MNKKVVDMNVVFSNRIEDALESLLGTFKLFQLTVWHQTFYTWVDIVIANLF